MNRIYPWVPLIFIGICFMNLINGVQTYGTQWEWGRYGLPRSLVTPDAVHYLDGTPVNLLQAQFIRARIEEEVFLVIASVLAILLLLLTREIRKMHLLKRKLAALRAANDRLQSGYRQ